MDHHHHADLSDEPDGRRPASTPGSQPESRPRSRRRTGARIAAALVGIVALLGAWQVFGLWWSWHSLERETFDEAGFDALPAVDAAELLVDTGVSIPMASPPSAAVDPGSADGGSTGDGDEADSDPYDAYLIVGSDRGDHRADVIILVLLPTDGSTPLMVSLPRDLYLPNRCTQGLTRINANYNGCGPDLNGPTQLAGAVEDFTGIEVDHFALFTFDGFEQIIDAVGGMEICVDNPVREQGKMELPAGCTMADGHTTLGWVRSRMTQELVNGHWRSMPGVNDLTRNQRQQDLILTVMARAGEFDSPGELTDFAASLSDAFTLDDRLSLAEAADLAWTHRNLSADDLIRMTIPVQPYTTSAGAMVLLPTASFDEVLAEYR
jgi:LCP family protein required for cell wall assembly